MSGIRAPEELAAQLRRLRERHPGLTIATELARLADGLAAFRAVLSIDGVPRATGHAALAADRTGAYVAAAELAAVAQALLLGGFADAVSPDIAAGVAVAAPAVVSDPAPARPTRAARAGRTGPGIVAGDEAVAPGAVEESAPAMSPGADPPTVADPPRDDAATAAPEDGTPEIAAMPPGGPAPESPRAPRAGRARGAPGPRTTEAAIAPPPEAADEGAPGPASGGDDGVATADPPAPARHRRRAAPPARMPVQEMATEPAATSAAPAAAPPTLGSLQAAWQPGRPIPAWWPPAREANPKRLGRQQLTRIEALGRAAELTTEQLDAYCQLLFHRGLPELASWQAAVLLERLDPRFPSPVAEVRSGRILHQLAVGDFVPIADGQVGFVRWGDLPTPPEGG